MIKDRIEIEVNGSKYEAKLDMGAIAEIQHKLREIKENVTVVEIFDLANKDNYKAINTIVIESIRRCHRQLSYESILDNLKLNDIQSIRQYVADLMVASLPSNEDKKKATDIEE